MSRSGLYKDFPKFQRDNTFAARTAKEKREGKSKSGSMSFFLFTNVSFYSVSGLFLVFFLSNSCFVFKCGYGDLADKLRKKKRLDVRIFTKGVRHSDLFFYFPIIASNIEPYDVMSL